MKFEVFTNDRYKILKIIFDNESEINNERYARLSQQEISELAKFSKVKVNLLLNELISFGIVVMYKNLRGKYSVTSLGKNVIETLNKEIKEEA